MTTAGFFYRPTLVTASREALTAQRRTLANAVEIKITPVVLCLLLVITTWRGVFLNSQADRAKTIADAVKQNSNLAMDFERHALLTFKSVDAAELLIAGEYARLGNQVNLAKYVELGYIDCC